MEATRTASATTELSHSWRELAHMPTYLVPEAIAGVLAVLVGLLTYAFDVSRAGAFVAVSSAEAFLALFGIVGLIGYAVSKRNVQNGAIIAMTSGLAMVVLVNGSVGLLLGLILLAGSLWSLGASR